MCVSLSTSISRFFCCSFNNQLCDVTIPHDIVRSFILHQFCDAPCSPLFMYTISTTSSLVPLSPTQLNSVSFYLKFLFFCLHNPCFALCILANYNEIVFHCFLYHGTVAISLLCNSAHAYQASGGIHP